MDLWGEKNKNPLFSFKSCSRLVCAISCPCRGSLLPTPQGDFPWPAPIPQSHVDVLLKKVSTFVCIVHIINQVQRSCPYGVSHEKSWYPEAQRLGKNFNAEIGGKDQNSCIGITSDSQKIYLRKHRKTEVAATYHSLSKKKKSKIMDITKSFSECNLNKALSTFLLEY